MRDPLDTCIVVTCGCGIRSARLLGAHSGWVFRGFVREFCGKAHSTSALRSGATASVLHLVAEVRRFCTLHRRRASLLSVINSTIVE